MWFLFSDVTNDNRSRRQAKPGEFVLTLVEVESHWFLSWMTKQAEHSGLVMANKHWWLCLLTSHHKYHHYPLINPQCLVKSIDDKAVIYLLTKILAHKYLEFHC